MKCPNCASDEFTKYGIRRKDNKSYQRFKCKKCNREWSVLSDVSNDDFNALKKVSIVSDFGKDSGTITTKSLNIKTLDDAILVSNVDMNIWDVDRYLINSWEVTCLVKTKDEELPKTFTNYQVKVFLKKKLKSCLEDSLNNIVDKIKPCNFKPIKIGKIKNPHLLEISLYDHHFGKLAWSKETGIDYDLKIAANLFETAVEDLIKKTVGYTVDQIVFPIGNDFFHIDDQANETPNAHHKLDTDGRLAKVFEVGIQSCIKAIERCLTIAPTHVLWVPGNHDPHTSYYLCKIIQAYFKNIKNFSIDVSEKSRKYYKYGTTLIGYTHGNEEPTSTLPLLMATEMKKEWCTSNFLEWHIGHTHKRKEMKFVSSDSFGPVKVISIPSLTATDYWHYKKGYVGGNRAAEAYLYGKSSGYVAHFNYNVSNS